MGSETLSFIDALAAGGPAADRAEGMMLYGRLVGAWDGTVTVYPPDSEARTSTCEAHFGWVLAGRAVQDVWIAPSRVSRAASATDSMYGTTLRIYEPKEDRWYICWLDPVRRDYRQMTGRPEGDDIVQEYLDAQGTICQWRFTDITADAFRWLSRESSDARKTWHVTSEFRFTRRRRPVKEPEAPTGRDVDPRRAFDFWVGVWNVVDPQSGEVLGASKVDIILAGQVLHEQWSGVDGYRGESFNVFDKDRKRWHQSWVSDNGTLLLLDGELSGGVMDLQGTSPDGERQRIRWTPQADGAVLQEWDSSIDEGRSWRRRFTGLYRRL